MILIDKTPPVPTGDSKQDVASVYDYLSYMQEQLNYILTIIDKRL